MNPNHVEPVAITQKLYQVFTRGVTTIELDNLAAEIAATMTTIHPDYAVLAARIAVSNLHKQTTKQYSKVSKDLYEYINPKTGLHSPMISKKPTTSLWNTKMN